MEKYKLVTRAHNYFLSELKHVFYTDPGLEVVGHPDYL